MGPGTKGEYHFNLLDMINYLTNQSGVDKNSNVGNIKDRVSESLMNNKAGEGLGNAFDGYSLFYPPHGADS
jgi:hypothetical protein